MFADHFAVGIFYRAGRGVEVAAQEFPERPLADEADPGAVRFVEYGQSGRMGAPSNFLFAQFAERKHATGECRRCNAVQKVALILGAVRRLQELRALGAVPQPSIVPGGDPRSSQALHVVETDAELDFPI